MAVTEAQFATLSATLEALLKQEQHNAGKLEEIQKWQIAHDLAHARSDSGGKFVPVLIDVVKMLAAALVSLLGYTKIVQHVQ